MNIQSVRLIFLCLFGAAAACLLGGCQTAQGDGNGAKLVGEQYWVSSEFTPFFRLGPQQATGPDLSLKKESRMTLTRKSYGYSEVVLEDGTSGWVASDDIKPIPQDILKAESSLMAAPSGPGGTSGRPKSKAVVEYSEQDLPSPPPEDLILPDPDAVPVIKPEFRF